jgi:hypothetical protein
VRGKRTPERIVPGTTSLIARDADDARKARCHAGSGDRAALPLIDRTRLSWGESTDDAAALLHRR